MQGKNTWKRSPTLDGTPFRSYGSIFWISTYISRGAAAPRPRHCPRCQESLRRLNALLRGTGRELSSRRARRLRTRLDMAGR